MAVRPRRRQIRPPPTHRTGLGCIGARAQAVVTPAYANFLKKLDVEKAVRDANAKGTLKNGGQMPAKAVVTVGGIDLKLEIRGRYLNWREDVIERSRPFGLAIVQLPSEGKGHKFESCRARHDFNHLVRKQFWLLGAAEAPRKHPTSDIWTDCRTLGGVADSERLRKISRVTGRAMYPLIPAFKDPDS
jgi:hypothetical protein